MIIIIWEETQKMNSTKRLRFEQIHPLPLIMHDMRDYINSTMIFSMRLDCEFVSILHLIYANVNALFLRSIEVNRMKWCQMLQTAYGCRFYSMCLMILCTYNWTLSNQMNTHTHRTSNLILLDQTVLVVLVSFRKWAPPVFHSKWSKWNGIFFGMCSIYHLLMKSYSVKTLQKCTNHALTHWDPCEIWAENKTRNVKK